MDKTTQAAHPAWELLIFKPVSTHTLTEWRRADQISPTVAGWYEVRNCGAWTRRNRLWAGYVNGRQMRYWDGASWRAGWDGSDRSIMGRCSSHQWRGLKCEVVS